MPDTRALENAGQSARGHDRRVAAQFGAIEGDQVLQGADIAVKDPGADAGGRVGSARRTGQREGDGLQFGRFFGQALDGDADAGQDAAADILASGIDQVEGDGRSRIDDDQRRREKGQRPGAIGDAVGTELGRAIDLQGDAAGRSRIQENRAQRSRRGGCRRPGAGPGAAPPTRRWPRSRAWPGRRAAGRKKTAPTMPGASAGGGGKRWTRPGTRRRRSSCCRHQPSRAWISSRRSARRLIFSRARK